MEGIQLNGLSRNRLWLVRWNHTKPDEFLIPDFPIKKSFAPAASTELRVEDLDFSPDGKWLLLKDIPGSYSFVVVPVEPDNPKYLGTPKLLGANLEGKELCSTAWVSKPLCFVASYGESIYKWELNKLLKIKDTR